MKYQNMVEYFKELVLEHYPSGLDGAAVPPPSFTAMKAVFIIIDPNNRTVEVKFPVLEETLNPFGDMQGGMIAAAVDKTVGSLSMLTGPNNFTRDLTLKYRNPVKGSNEYIVEFLFRLNLADICPVYGNVPVRLYKLFIYCIRYYCGGIYLHTVPYCRIENGNFQPLYSRHGLNCGQN